ncbi:hypothetical protein ACIF6L_34860 [Kitasatospora sp. NPDC086009]|uniref:hypothetical protein n=1 Tax=unclassified Kitasatospora TaxID=2633591 RepID=UPI0037CA0954
MNTTTTTPIKTCPVHPEKNRYATAEAAESAAAPRAILLGYGRQRPYLCGACDWWHISTKPPRVVHCPVGPDGGPLDRDGLVAWINDRPREVLHHLVLKDLEHLLAPELTAALRDPRCNAAWLHTIKQLRTAAAVAVNGPLGSRRAARARLALLTAARSEARALTPARPVAPAPGKAGPGTVRDYAAAALARRRAAEARAAAVDLLIGRHPEEWAQLLDHTRWEHRLPPVDENGAAA